MNIHSFPPFTLPRFYPILDSDALLRNNLDPVRAAEQILAGGARILQFRHKGFYSREVFATLERIATACRAAQVPFVVNDRADLAAILAQRIGQTILHLGQDDLRPSEVRNIVGKDAIIGFSTHNEQQLRDAATEPVNYVALGPIFGTVSKLRPDPVVGVKELQRLRPISTRPLVAIGGITRGNANEVLAAGADSVAVIADLFPEDVHSGDENARALALRTRIEEWLRLTAGSQ